MYLHLEVGDLVVFPQGLRGDMLAGTVVELREKCLRVAVKWAEMNWDRRHIGSLFQTGYEDVEIAEWNEAGMKGGQLIEAETIRSQKEKV